jgi:drug/metabolite transporter (DMT)-like permease
VVSVVTGATLVTVMALAGGAFRGVSWESALPYTIAGLCAPSLSHLAMYRSIDRFGGTRTAVVLGVVPVLAAVGRG